MATGAGAAMGAGALERVSRDTDRTDSPGLAPDGGASWLRLAIALALTTIGGSGMWTVVVVLPAVQAEFGADRGAASVPYTCLMIAIGIGGVLTGRAADRIGIARVAGIGSLVLGAGFILSGLSPNLAAFALAQGCLVGLGCSANFGPLMADISFWFQRRRGIAVALVASGNYLAGALWPPIVQHLVSTVGWRQALVTVGVACICLMLPLTWFLGRRPIPPVPSLTAARPAFTPGTIALKPNTLQILLALAGVGCCVAMSMPQVHIVAYCGDLGYGTAHGAEMLSLMLGLGIVSRIASGVIADRVGGLLTLLGGSALQAAALALYMMFDGLTSLFVISALFGLFQGGIVPSYAIIVREYFPGPEAAARVGICLGATLLGMALGGWLSGVIFDLTGSYQAAFANGIAWNVLNESIVLFLIFRRRTGRAQRHVMREAVA